MTDYDTITRIASQSGSLRQKIEAELILKDKIAKENAALPPSAFWHGRHRPYANDWRQDDSERISVSNKDS